MKRLLILIAFLPLGGCFLDPGSSAGFPRSIADEWEADEVFEAIKSFLSSLESEIPEGNVSMSIEGDAGSAYITGDRTVYSTSSSYSSYDADLIDIYVDCNEFTPEGTTMIITGTLRYFNSESYRIACSGSFCSSDNDHSSAIETRPSLSGDIEFIDITLQLYDGDWIQESMSIDASSPSYTYSWTSVLIEIEGGESYSL
jgi:hypothetical protein